MRTSYTNINPRRMGREQPSKSTTCESSFSDDVLITMRSPEHPRARRYTPEQTDNTDRQLGIKNTRQVTPWGVLPVVEPTAVLPLDWNR